MPVSIVGLGPGDPQWLTRGALATLRRAKRAVLLDVPRDLAAYLRAKGVRVRHGDPTVAGLIVRGASAEIEPFAERIAKRASASGKAQTIAIGVLGNPLSDVPGLAMLARALTARGAHVTLVPGMPKAALAAAVEMALIPLPPQSARYTWDELIAIMARLRLGCPWDREQTHRTLVPYLIEEAYEVVETIEAHDRDALCDELGDLLLQIVFHAQIASESAAFTVADVIDALCNKMVRRHPHVFADAVIADVDAQWRSWEALKATEKVGLARASRLDGIPKHLGALQRGQRMQEKAARVGFDWPDVAGVLDKLTEEMTELAEARREAADDPHVREELGDVFFTLVNLARALGIDAETAMREANEKFYRRFTFMERRASSESKKLADLTTDELEVLWNLAKTSPEA